MSSWEVRGSVTHDTSFRIMSRTIDLRSFVTSQDGMEQTRVPQQNNQFIDINLIKNTFKCRTGHLFGERFACFRYSYVGPEWFPKRTLFWDKLCTQRLNRLSSLTSEPAGAPMAGIWWCRSSEAIGFYILYWFVSLWNYFIPQITIRYEFINNHLEFSYSPIFSKQIVNSPGFTYGSRLSKRLHDFKDFIEMPPCRFSVFLTIVNASCFGPTQKWLPI